uniref:Uncharacterized protein n=1 Tax=Octopus bimaculoides TaxID=37653 RepID=A0A0L8FUN3_OCTBM
MDKLTSLPPHILRLVSLFGVTVNATASQSKGTWFHLTSSYPLLSLSLSFFFIS